MENIEQYGDLTEAELLEFLDEIQNDDEDIQEAQSDAQEKIVLEEEHTQLIEVPENAEIEERYGDKAWIKLNDNTIILRDEEERKKASMAFVKANRQRSQRFKEDRIRIQREAFSQNIIKLSDPIGNDKIKILVSLLVKEHTRMINKHSDFINKRLATLLNPFIPRRLRICKSLYPESIRISPGFLYRASKEFGGGLTFWAMPNIPYYFPQNTEQKILMDNKPDFLIQIDKSISFYHEHTRKRSEKELRYASMIIQKGVYSYFELLKLNPFWYEELYNYLVKK